MQNQTGKTGFGGLDENKQRDLSNKEEKLNNEVGKTNPRRDEGDADSDSSEIRKQSNKP